MLPITALCAASLALAPVSSNIDFRNGLREWIGEGFYLTKGGTPESLAVCSSGAGSPKRKGMIRYVFVVPKGVAEIRCRAYASVPSGAAGNDRLDVLLLRPGKKIVPKEVRTDSIWMPASGLQSQTKNGPREYVWDVAPLAGRTVQLVIIDFDERPGYYVYCTGFRLLPSSAEPPRQSKFDQTITALAKKHRLAPMARYDSKHFAAVSNAGHRFTRSRLQWCEYFYSQFFQHFKEHGFPANRPEVRLKVVAFASPKGFDAYFNKRMPSTMNGIYDPKDNRLVLYDLRNNRDLIGHRDHALKLIKTNDVWLRDDQKAKIQRLADEIAARRNLSTVLHETAHLLSFNCGILNRNGDAPLWLVEGFACYCEAATNEGWSGFGAHNDTRVADLVRYRDHRLTLKKLIANDAWRDTKRTVLVGYAQSWALFCWLMETRPRKLVRYCRLIYPRRTPDHRVTDFAQVFGADWDRLEAEFERNLSRVTSR